MQIVIGGGRTLHYLQQGILLIEPRPLPHNYCTTWVFLVCLVTPGDLKPLKDQFDHDAYSHIVVDGKFPWSQGEVQDINLCAALVWHVRHSFWLMTLYRVYIWYNYSAVICLLYMSARSTFLVFAAHGMVPDTHTHNWVLYTYIVLFMICDILDFGWLR